VLIDVVPPQGIREHDAAGPFVRELRRWFQRLRPLARRPDQPLFVQLEKHART
jgi:hypothetical protein